MRTDKILSPVTNLISNALRDLRLTMTQIQSFEESLPKNEAGPMDATAVLTAVETNLLARKDYHRLFDAKMMQVRQQMGLPVTRPASLAGIPAENETAYRQAYLNAAREIGQLFLDDGRLPDAWAYFRTIGEPKPVQDAIEKIAIPGEPDAAFDEILNLALYEGAHYVRGLYFLLKTHGTCNTVTAMGQLMPQMSPDERQQAAAMMVQNIYSDLQRSVRHDVESRMPVLNGKATLSELISGREWLFENGNYHIDVSHLHATVGFARHLNSDAPELQQAIELAEYGSRLAEPLRYPADVPFDDYYNGHLHFLHAIAGINPEDSLQYFIDRLNAEPDEPDKKLIAFVVVDLGQRIGQLSQALEVAAPFLNRLEDPAGFSFTEACVDANRLDLLEQFARENDDILSMATVLLTRKAD
ncbi:MAG: hypothetical protein R3C20_23450 [Planctomycetaceae bacterium]